MRNFLFQSQVLLNAADCWPPGLFGLLGLGEILHCSTFFHLSNFGVMPLMAGSLGLGP